MPLPLFRPGDLGLALVQGLAALAALAASLWFSDDALCALINAGLFLLPFLLCAALTGRRAASLAFATGFALLLWGVGEFKLRYFGNRLALLDFYFLSEGANWSIVRRYPYVQAGLAAFLGLVALLALQAWRADRRLPRYGGGARLACAALLAGWCALAWNGRTHHQWTVFQDDADCGLIKTCGVMARLVYSAGMFEFADPLPGGDPGAFMAAAAALPPPAARAGARPDVVIWLQESTLEPTQYRLDGARPPRLAMFARDARTRAAGLLRVHTFGGKTWLSEFSLLTGLVPEDFGARRALVFNSVAPLVRSHLVARFEANGYDSAVLMPTPPRFYGAARTYAALGFDRILTLRDFPEYARVRGDEWDISTSERLGEAAASLVRRQREQHPTRPLLLYLLSVKEHAPYSARHRPGYGLREAGLRRSLAAKLSDYFERLEKLDSGVKTLERELRRGSRPAVWALFGDHQAYFEEAAPAYRLTLSQPELLTQYRLRSTLPLATDAPALLDIALLPSLIADAAGLAPDDYFRAQSAIRRLCGGGLGDCRDPVLVASYKGYVFSPGLALFEPASAQLAGLRHGAD